VDRLVEGINHDDLLHTIENRIAERWWNTFSETQTELVEQRVAIHTEALITHFLESEP
jgi:hypothetical protein